MRRGLVIRTDGGMKIGFGHVIRCGSIAAEAIRLGYSVLFVVSDDVAAKVVRSAGFDVQLLDADSRAFSDVDALSLVRRTVEFGAGHILVDAYAATPAFLSHVHALCRIAGIDLAYMDDLYRYDSGFLGRPCAYDVDVVINYSFGVKRDDYRKSYAGLKTVLLAGPAFAPVRREFKDRSYQVADRVNRVLVTSGATNPDRVLERMALAVMEVVPGVEVDVVVGPAAKFDGRAMPANNVNVVYSPSDMSTLMMSADMAISAAGSTLYELACMGVPTVAVAIVDNQLANLAGWARLGLGPAVNAVTWSELGLREAVKCLAGDCVARERRSEILRGCVDGMGAFRIAMSLCEGN